MTPVFPREDTQPQEDTQLGTPTAPVAREPRRRRRNAPWVLAGFAALILLCIAAYVSFEQAFNEVAAGMVAEGVGLSVEEAQALVEANTGDPTAYGTLGWAYYYAMDYDNARRAFEQTLNLGLDDPEELLAIAIALGEADINALAMNYHAALFPLDPTNIQAREESYKVAMSLLREDYDEGRAQLEQLAAEVTGWGLPDAALALAELQRPEPNLAFAAERIYVALESEPDSPVAHFAMGRVCEEQNDITCAQAEYRVVLSSPLADPRLIEITQSQLDAMGDGS